MNIVKPNKEDFDAVLELVSFLNKIVHGLNPIYQPADPEDGDDIKYLSNAPADEVFKALGYKYVNADLPWIMTVLNTLLSSNNDIVDQESSVLDFSPKFKQAVKDTERLDFLFKVETVEFSKNLDGKYCCFLYDQEVDIHGFGDSYRAALDEAMVKWEDISCLPE